MGMNPLLALLASSAAGGGATMNASAPPQPAPKPWEVPLGGAPVPLGGAPMSPGVPQPLNQQMAPGLPTNPNDPTALIQQLTNRNQQLAPLGAPGGAGSPGVITEFLRGIFGG